MRRCHVTGDDCCRRPAVPRLALNTTEAAESCGVSVDSIKAAIRSGSLRAKRSARKENGDPAGRYLVTVDALQAWIDGLADA